MKCETPNQRMMRKFQEKTARRAEWKRIFVWSPVELIDGSGVKFQFVERRYIWDWNYAASWFWKPEYRRTT